MLKVWHIIKTGLEHDDYLAIGNFLYSRNTVSNNEAELLNSIYLRDRITNTEPYRIEEALRTLYRILRNNSPDYNTPIQLAPGRMPISALLDLTQYINSVYGTGHLVTHRQADSTYHIYRDILIGHIPEIQYDLDRKRFEPRDVHINLRSFERTLEEYQFLNMFAEDPEIPKHESEEVEKFFTPPESPRPQTP